MTIQAKTRFSYKVNPKKYCFTKQPCFMLIGWVILEASLLLLLLKSSMQTHIGGPCSSPVEGDEGWINPNLKLCLWQKKKCIIPYIFNNWANSVVHLLLLTKDLHHRSFITLHPHSWCPCLKTAEDNINKQYSFYSKFLYMHKCNRRKIAGPRRTRSYD